MRDAKADVTDMRAPSKTQNVRRKNMAFDIDAERERTVEELGGLEKDVDMVPVPRPWEEPGAKRRRWWKAVKRWWGGAHSVPPGPNSLAVVSSSTNDRPVRSP